MHGVFANIITVPTEYETAIEMCLGASLQNIVTDTEEDAKKLIEHLRKNNLGRVSFLPITQYGESAIVKEYQSFSNLIDSFYFERDRVDRMKVKSQDLHRTISNITERLARKINLQTSELEKCKDRDTLRIKGDLLQANLYRIQRGASSVTVENYYDENKPIEITLNPAITPANNVQKYYKDYRKAKTAETMLTEQIKNAKEELVYLDSVADTLDRAVSEKDLSQIRLELTEQGYIKAQKGKQKPPQALPPIEYTTSDGFKVLVGRNNKQNDKLTLKTARKTDLWFHTKEIHGSHTILVLDGKEPTDIAITEAAQIAAYHSKAQQSNNVPVDYTLVKNVNKPTGAKPGMVIYLTNKTAYVMPQIPTED